MCIHLYICVHRCLCMLVSVCNVYMYMHVYMCICFVRTCLCVCLSVCVHVRVHVCVLCVRACVRACVCVLFIYVYLCVHLFEGFSLKGSLSPSAWLRVEVRLTLSLLKFWFALNALGFTTLPYMHICAYVQIC